MAETRCDPERKLRRQSEPSPARRGVPSAQAGFGGPDPDGPPDAGGAEAQPLLHDVASVAGYVLAVSYPVLALSTGVRGVFQLFFKPESSAVVGPALSVLAAFLYLIATIGFAYRRRWTWYLSFGVLSLETVLTVAVGFASLAAPETIGSTAWRRFGADYGFFPLFQPLLGLLWLTWPVTVAAYGVRPSWLRRAWSGSAAGQGSGEGGAILPDVRR